MKFIPYARSGECSSKQDLENWYNAKELIDGLSKLPEKQEFSILLIFLVEYSGLLYRAECQMNEMLIEQAAISYEAASEAVRMIQNRILDLFDGRC